MPVFCKICSAESVELFARGVVLGRYDVRFNRCAACGFVCTEEPYWLEEAYADAITGSDIGLVSRNLAMAKIARVIISSFFATNGQFLDYAGGYGLFVRLMRDQGVDFYWYDKHCTNIFARQFEFSENDGAKYEMITAFEVMEHLDDPMAELDLMLKTTRNILFSTELLPKHVPKPAEWWYYGLEHGQHVSFYTKKSLEVIASRLGLNFYSNGKSLHLFSEKKISATLFFLLARSKAASILAPLLPRKTLLFADVTKISQKGLQLL
jgi:hypothetical protein